MKKILHIKYIAFFMITFATGFLANEKIKNFSHQDDSYSEKEAVAHLNKKVKSLCNASFVTANETSGRTVFLEKDEYIGGYMIVIDWDYSLRGKHEIIMYEKPEYEKCVVEVGETER